MASDAVVADGGGSESPVLSVVSKRLRALKKKYNRIVQTEEAVAQGKPLNKEQEDLLLSKPVVSALIDELSRLRQPLSSALQAELSLSPDAPPAVTPAAAAEDIVTLLYFGSLFDVNPQSEFVSTMLTRAHERECCITYDYVGDEANADLLAEHDLDSISGLAALLTSRPASSGVSHRNALQGCLRHASLWIENSGEAIQPGCSITYAGLRQKLNKIIASDYCIRTPEMKASVDVAAAIEKYATAFQVQVSDSGEVISPEGEAGASLDHQEHQEFDPENEGDVFDPEQPEEVPPNPVEPEEVATHAEVIQVEPEEVATHAELASDQEPHDLEQQAVEEPEEESREQQNLHRRPYNNNQRGGFRGGGGGRRGYYYANGRGGPGGRSGGGGYHNGRSQYYDPGYYPRNYGNARGGRGGRTGGGPAMHGGGYGGYGAAQHSGGRIPRNIEVGGNGYS